MTTAGERVVQLCPWVRGVTPPPALSLSAVCLSQYLLSLMSEQVQTFSLCGKHSEGVCLKHVSFLRVTVVTVNPLLPVPLPASVSQLAS